MKRILLVNPPIYDFSAYDFWLKPYGVLRVGGFLRGKAEIRLFDFLDRNHSSLEGDRKVQSDAWGRGRFSSKKAPRPEAFSSLEHTYRRYGINREYFEEYLLEEGPFDFALIQTSMTYWYQGVEEVLSTIRNLSPNTRTVLGGTYATICPDHARSLSADLVVEGFNLDVLWGLLDLDPDMNQEPYWEGYPESSCGIIKITDGCPFRCTYCSVPEFHPTFRVRSFEEGVRSLRQLNELGVSNIVFYDDALLFRHKEILTPFLERVEGEAIKPTFHTPNALNARFLDDEIAPKMVGAGFQHFYLGFESDSIRWQRKTGNKVYPHELERAVASLSRAGASMEHVTCYLIMGHPSSDQQDLEDSMQFANRMGIKIMLSEFSPIPGTVDGERCRQWVDLDEPLNHNKFFFTRLLLGEKRVQELKSLCRELNENGRVPELTHQ